MCKRYHNLGTLIFALHLIALLGLFNVQYPAEDATLLGRYTMRYALLLGGAVFVTLVWGVVTLWHERISAWVARLPRQLVLVLGATSPIVVWILWQFDVNRSATWFMMMSLYALVIYVAHQQKSVDNERAMPSRWMPMLMGVIAVGLALLFALQSLSTPAGYAPQDEAAWADVATMYYRQNTKVFHVFLDAFPQALVTPGTGAFIPLILGLPLQHIDFSPYIGRILVILSYSLGAFFAYRATRHQGNHTSALLSAILLLSSMNLVQAHEFRPHHLLPALAGILLWLVVCMPTAQNLASRWRLAVGVAFAIGLLAASSIQFHAAGVVYAFAFSSFFAILLFWRIGRRQHIRATFWYQIIPFGLGALISVGFFIVVNIQAVGGLENYLDSFIEGSRRNYSFLPVYLTQVYGIYWRVDIVLMIAGWLGGLWIITTSLLLSRLTVDYPAWRISPPIQWVTGLWLLTMFFGIWIDPGYPHLYTMFLAILGGVLVGELYPRIASRFAGRWLPFFVAFAVLPGVAVHFSWADIGRFMTGQQPPLYGTYTTIAERLEPYWTEDDRMLSTDLLLWSLYQNDNWVSIHSGIIYQLAKPDADPIQQWRDLGINIIAYVDDNSFVTSGRFGVMDGVLAYMQEGDYWVCDSFIVEPYTISIYRPQADLDTHYCPNPERIYDEAN